MREIQEGFVVTHDECLRMQKFKGKIEGITDREGFEYVVNPENPLGGKFQKTIWRLRSWFLGSLKRIWLVDVKSMRRFFIS